MDLSFRHFAGIGDDYHSGTELPHSKGCRHLNLLIAFGFNLHRPQVKSKHAALWRRRRNRADLT
jgi:hypothetical protein